VPKRTRFKKPAGLEVGGQLLDLRQWLNNGILIYKLFPAMRLQYLND